MIALLNDLTMPGGLGGPRPAIRSALAPVSLVVQLFEFLVLVQGFDLDGVFVSSGRRRPAAGRRAAYLAIAADAFPHLQAVHWNLRIDLEPQFDGPAVDREHDDFEQALKAGGTANHNRFLVFPA
jgi:hypothetical protein